jgi:23S rRNA (guanosine2251-2'-O)-methyltransferase
MARAAGSGDEEELLCGLHAVQEALKAGTRPFQKLLVLRTDRQFSDLIRLARAQHIPVHVEPRPVFDRAVPSGKHQGVIALVAAKTYATEEEILTRVRRQNTPGFLLVLDSVEDPRNLGAVLRTADAAGVQGVFIPERRAAGLTATVAKTSAGALDHLLVGRVTNVSQLLERLKDDGFWIYGLAPAAEKSYTSLDYRGPIVLVLGGEGKGARPGVLAACDETVSIPMIGRVASLNLSAAAAIVLYEAVRQRQG